MQIRHVIRALALGHYGGSSRRIGDVMVYTQTASRAERGSEEPGVSDPSEGG